MEYKATDNGNGSAGSFRKRILWPAVLLLLLSFTLQGGCFSPDISCAPIQPSEEIKTLEVKVDSGPREWGLADYYAPRELEKERIDRIAYFQKNSSDLALMIHERINRVRKAHGLNFLQWDPHLAEIALSHSKDMAIRNYFDHVSPEGKDFSDRYREHGYSKTTRIGDREYLGGENLFLGNVVISYTYDQETKKILSYELCTLEDMAERAVNGWMESPGHRENILTPFSREGIGVYVKDDGEVYITQNFS